MYPVIYDFGEISILGFSFHPVINSYGFMLMLAFYACYYFLNKDLKMLGHKSSLAGDIIFAAAVGGIVGSRIYFIIENFDQGNNDLTKAILFAHKLEAKAIDIIGVDGGKSDHQFCNYMSLVECQTNARIHLDDCTVSVITKNSSKYHSIEPGTSFSLFSLGTCLGVNLAGAKWELNNSKLTSSSNGLHNIATSEKLAITCESGDLLLFINR